MREVVKKHSWTNLLDDGKPYLVLDTKSGLFYIQYWRVFYLDGVWQGSDWCDVNGKVLSAENQAKCAPKPCRVFKLPTISYRRAKKIVKDH